MTTVDPITLLDLTSLNDDDDEKRIIALCERATTPRGHVAAVCVYGPLGPIAVRELRSTPIRVATVATFPAGDDDPAAAADEVAAQVADGVDEVDVVAPWRAHLAGDTHAVGRLVAACVDAAGGKTLKVILETGSHPDAATTRAMADAALAAGASFLKTSTGKHGPGATPEAFAVLLDAVKAAGHGGVKASGGVRTADQADAYVAQAAAALGDAWVSPETVRLGASSLLDDLLARS
jgi:deoxyribose-phosphate aldolase